MPAGDSAAESSMEGDVDGSVSNEPAAPAISVDESADTGDAPDSAAQLAEFSGNVNVEDVR